MYNCPTCKTELIDNIVTSQCCDTSYHADCFEEYSGCTRFECRNEENALVAYDQNSNQIIVEETLDDRLAKINETNFGDMSMNLLGSLGNLFGGIVCGMGVSTMGYLVINDALKGNTSTAGTAIAAGGILHGYKALKELADNQQLLERKPGGLVKDFVMKYLPQKEEVGKLKQLEKSEVALLK